MQLFFLLFNLFTLQIQQKQVVYIQPLGHVKAEYIHAVSNALESFYNVRCVIREPVNATTDILMPSRIKYDANKILSKYNNDQHTIIVTEKDIAHYRSPTIPEWGIFGLAQKHGKTAVISSFRLRKPERLKKVAIHELGHNFGLDHCITDNSCLMSAAKGTLKQVDREQFRFCQSCQRKISSPSKPQL